MMPQYEQSSSTYGRYEEQQAFTQQQNETPNRRPSKGETLDDDFVDAVSEQIVQRLRQETAGKVYPEPRDNNNLLRLIVFAIAMVTLIAFGLLCLVFVGGTGGWVSFCAACLAIFIIAVVAIDKVK